MITQDIIDEATKLLVALYHPQKIYLFGSYAWGVPTDESDLDLMVILDEFSGNPVEMAVEGHMILGPLRIAKDLVLNTASTFEQRASFALTLQAKIKQDGLILYERN